MSVMGYQNKKVSTGGGWVAGVSCINFFLSMFLIFGDFVIVKPLSESLILN